MTDPHSGDVGQRVQPTVRRPTVLRLRLRLLRRLGRLRRIRWLWLVWLVWLV
ncbi:hypothetical protein ACIO3R_15125 [Streptomyces sp. NPDC087428]|uniref:hypothetical protein n=1 Tax=Streptomyces sp. NPDC087428 TaxID=3365788 RepID=UPI00382E4A0A